MRAWTPIEERLIELCYPDSSTRELANIIGRSRDALHEKARQMGVRKSARFLALAVRNAKVRSTKARAA